MLIPLLVDYYSPEGIIHPVVCVSAQTWCIRIFIIVIAPYTDFWMVNSQCIFRVFSCLGLISFIFTSLETKYPSPIDSGNFPSLDWFWMVNSQCIFRVFSCLGLISFIFTSLETKYPSPIDSGNFPSLDWYFSQIPLPNMIYHKYPSQTWYICSNSTVPKWCNYY